MTCRGHVRAAPRPARRRGVPYGSPRQNETARSYDGASTVTSTGGFVFPFQTRPADAELASDEMNGATSMLLFEILVSRRTFTLSASLYPLLVTLNYWSERYYSRNSSSIETPSTFAKPYSSMSVTVRCLSSMREMEPRQI